MKRQLIESLPEIWKIFRQSVRKLFESLPGKKRLFENLPNWFIDHQFQLRSR
jgi:hypothetical protein